jgi:Gpi18-like mannosyltransferase
MGSNSIQRAWQALQQRPAVLLGLALALGVAVRLPFLNSWTSDTFVCVAPWVDQIIGGGLKRLGESFPCLGDFAAGEYSPPYYYFLYVASLFHGLAPSLWLAKLPSLAFDLLAAFFAYKITRLTQSQTRALLAGAAVYLAPSMIANSAWWGQCDVIWGSLFLGTVYFALVKRPLAAVALFGVALALKAQAIFIAPFLLLLFLRGEVRLWHGFVVPLIIAAMLLPAVALGRSWESATMTYIRQGGAFAELSKNAPNLYYFIPNTYYAVGVVVGTLLTVTVCAALAFLPRFAGTPAMRPGERSLQGIEARLLAATMFVALAPFLLPKMHDRYFFAADILSIVLAFCAPRYWFLPVLFQLSSMGAYVGNIYAALTKSYQPIITEPLAALINTVTVSYLVLEYVRVCTRFGGLPSTLIKELPAALAAVIAATGAWIVIAVAWHIVGERVCGSDGASLCAVKLHPNLGYAGAADWLMFLPLLALAFIAARIVLQRAPTWLRTWRRVDVGA